MGKDLDFRSLVTVPANIKDEVEVIDTDVTEMDLNVEVGEVEPNYGEEGQE